MWAIAFYSIIAQVEPVVKGFSPAVMYAVRWKLAQKAALRGFILSMKHRGFRIAGVVRRANG